MFPTGAAGVALILLRVSVAITLFTQVMPQGSPAAHLWTSTGVGLLGVAICLGLFTPMSSIACCLIQAATLLDMKIPALTLTSSILVAASLGLLGPGAYSLDARMFGRRLVVSSSDKTMTGD
jgi:NO-binding membrane sensor protein with MHYT domain